MSCSLSCVQPLAVAVALAEKRATINVHANAVVCSHCKISLIILGRPGKLLVGKAFLWLTTLKFQARKQVGMPAAT